MRTIRFLAALALLTRMSPAIPAEYNPVVHEPRAASAAPVLEVIVKLRPNATAANAKLSNGAERLTAVAKRTGIDMAARREISADLVAGEITVSGATTEAALDKLRADAGVEYAVADRRRFIQATPNDSLFTGQWYLQNTETSAINAIGAWDAELGAAGVVVAVLDTGVLYDHPDLGRGDHSGRLLPGYDFVSAAVQANDGDGRDANPSDPGDWVNDADKANAALANCDVTGSSWHGTRVSGMIGALTNNGVGVSGLSWNSFILPVRVLGKCGGTDSDILAGMRWAAGLTVPGVPVNPTPARILNMSLGATGPCEASYRDVIAELHAHKVLVVISAGNEGTVVSSPANCPEVAAVAALRHAGSKVGFSNLGPEVTLGAPGGNCVNVNGGPCLFSLDTTSNTGTTVPGTHTYTDQTNSNLGTSFSAPIVSGIAALMVARNNNLSTDELLARLREAAQPFPVSLPAEPTVTACHVPVDTSDVQLEQCLCTATTCGAGMADAAASVAAADRPIAAIAVTGAVSPGQNVALDASGSAAACGRTMSGFEWTPIAPTGSPPTIVGATTSTATVVAPTTGTITVRVTVTDNLGHLDAADVVVGPTTFSTNAPASAGSTPCAPPVTSGVTPGAPTTPVTPSTPSKSSGGGGGAFDALSLGLLGAGVVMAAVLRRRRRDFFRCI